MGREGAGMLSQRGGAGGRPNGAGPAGPGRGPAARDRMPCPHTEKDPDRAIRVLGSRVMGA
jgi:hypothetical protein